MMNLMQSIRCKITARQLSRYVDMDPSAMLSEAEIKRARRHLAECEKCTATVQDLKIMKIKLLRMGSSYSIDGSRLTKLKGTLDNLSPRKE